MSNTTIDAVDILPEFDLVNTPLKDHILIEANAGTGKTYTIIRIFIRLLLENQYPPSSILVVTFTEAATKELKERTYLLIREALNSFIAGKSDDLFITGLLSRINRETAINLLRTALRDFDTVSIHTIHGFCQKILYENSFESGIAFESSVITEQNTLIQQITNDYWRLNFYTESPLFIAYAIQSGLSPDKFKELVRIAGNFNRNLKIIPERTCPEYLNEETLFQESFNELKQVWIQYRNEIVSILGNGNLKASKYSPKIIQELVSSMDLMLSCEKADPVLFERFENFTQSILSNYTKNKCISPEHCFFNLCEKHMQLAERLKNCYDLKIIDLKKRYLSYLNHELTTRKKSKGQLYFDDLLNNVYTALKYGKQSKDLITRLRKNYRAALIDEFQDTDAIQYEIFSMIFDRQIPLFFIGDPKQSIYGFRNADIFTYLHASEHVTQKYTLLKNYRSDPSFISALNTLFLKTDNQFVYKDIKYVKAAAGISDNSQQLAINEISQPSLKFIFIDEETVSNHTNDRTVAICSSVANEISELLSSGLNKKACINNKPLSPSDIAVLVRTNREAKLMQQNLSRLHVPSIIDSESSVFETEDAVDLLRLMAALIEPARADLIRAVLASQFFNLDAVSIDKLSSSQKSWESYTARFLNYHDLWRNHGFMYMFRHFLSEEHIRPELLSRENGERHLTNILHLSELIHLNEQQQKSGMSNLYLWFSKKISDSSLKVSDEEILRLESDKESINILTIHKSKGLEFPIVFCPFWHNSELRNKKDPYVFHDPENFKQLILPLGPEEIENNRNVIEKEMLAENMRLLYVALTRAKSCCYIIWGKIQGSESSALAYLLHKNTCDDKMVSVLKDKVKQLSSEQIWQTLTELNNLNSSIAVFRAKTDTTPIFSEQIKIQDFSFQKLNRPIPEPWKISSFSSLTRIHNSGESPDYDSIYDKKNKSNEDEDKQINDIFSFPKGSIAGTFLHSVLEKISFNEFESEKIKLIIEQQLDLHGFDQSWNPVIAQLVRDVISTPLDGKDLRLRNIADSSCIKEMEFCFPLKKITPDNIKHIFSNQIQTDLFTSCYQAENLFFSPVSGYMKGFVDLVFRYNDYYYLLDWKSNHIGNTPDDYQNSRLMDIMKNEHYSLQYHIYLAALDNYLELRHTDYKYQKNFGGVFYVFLRGINGVDSSGVYYDRPKHDVITKLRSVLID